MYQKHDHSLYCSWDMAHDGCNCHFSFWAIFCPFSPLKPKKWKYQKIEKKKISWRYHHFTQVYQKSWSQTAWKMKISKNWKNRLEISSFYNNVPKIMTIGYTVPEIWRMTNVIIIFLGYFLPFYSPNSWKNENIKKKFKNIKSWFITKTS